MKFGKVLTYKDIDEAEKIIGKKVIHADSFKYIETRPDKWLRPTILTGVDKGDSRYYPPLPAVRRLCCPALPAVRRLCCPVHPGRAVQRDLQVGRKVNRGRWEDYSNCKFEEEAKSEQ